MAKSSIGSFFKAILVAVIIFFALYFFVPSFSNQFFGISYQAQQDVKALREIVSLTLDERGVPKEAKERYLEQIDSSIIESEHTRESLAEALTERAANIELGIPLTELRTLLGSKLKSLGGFTSRQLSVLKRVISEIL